MIFIGLGTNLPLADQRRGAQVLIDALQALKAAGLTVAQVSRFFRSEPVPVSTQDWFVNAVAELRTNLSPEQILAILHATEDAFGRQRGARNAPRTLDLDLLCYHTLVRPESGPAPHLPHPRLDQRAFVLLPLNDLAPQWCHPITGMSLARLIAALPPGQRLEPLAPQGGEP